MNKYSTNLHITSIVKLALYTSMVVFFLSPLLLVLISTFGGGRYLEFPPPTITVEWYKDFFQDSTWIKALTNSLLVASIVSLIDIPVATLAAYWMQKAKSLSRISISTLLLLPALVPVISYAVSLYVTCAKVTFIDGRILLILAHTSICLPYAYLIMRSGIMSIDRDLVDAARTLGASPIHCWYLIIIPLLKWHIIIAILVTFIISFTEPVLAIFLTSGDTATLPQKTWEGLRYGIDPKVLVSTAFAIYLFIIAVLSVGALRYLNNLRLIRRH